MIFISVVPHNRELLIINDMDVFVTNFCYVKRQKMGPPGESATITDGTNDADRQALGRIEDSEDADLLPAANLGFRNEK